MKRLMFRLLMVLLIILGSYGAGEIIVYSLFKKELALFPRYVTGVTYNEFKIRRNEPNARYRHKSYDGEWRFKINSRGFRSDIEYRYDKSPNTFRVLVLGDSYTFGHEVNQDETYSVIIEKKLKEKGISIEVINAGVSGFSTAEELIFYEQEGVKYNPDILILGYYSNDMRDNIRTDLMRLENNNLVINKKEYQPAVKVRDFLNSFFIYRWLSEYSYLHNYLNVVATRIVKKDVAKKNLQSMGSENPGLEKAIADTREIALPEDMANRGYEVQLTCKLIARIMEIADMHNTKFILLDIALDVPGARPALFPSFPQQCIEEEGIDNYINSAELLKQYKGSRDDLYRPHGRNHWTALSHDVVGDNLAGVIYNIIIGKFDSDNDYRKAN